MTLREKQSEFVKMVARLILYADSLGYELTFGDASAIIGHRRGSFHYKRLAIDLNLFIDGKYQRSTAEHATLGVYWLKMGGTWGGCWSDGNHYSLGETKLNYINRR